MEETGVDEASNEWKDAGRLGRARFSSRFAQSMLLWSLRGQRGHVKKKRKRMGVEAQFQGQTKGRVDAQSVSRVCEGPEADAHARRTEVWWARTEGMDQST